MVLKRSLIAKRHRNMRIESRYARYGATRRYRLYALFPEMDALGKYIASPRSVHFLFVFN